MCRLSFFLRQASTGVTCMLSQYWVHEDQQAQCKEAKEELEGMGILFKSSLARPSSSAMSSSSNSDKTRASFTGA